MTPKKEIDWGSFGNNRYRKLASETAKSLQEARASLVARKTPAATTELDRWQLEQNPAYSLV